MNMILYIDIDKKYRLGIVPSLRSNILVSACPECAYDACHIEYVIGFYDWNGYAVIARECPHCFCRWWNHMDKDMYDTFLEFKQL
jgi:hypothetical protein